MKLTDDDLAALHRSDAGHPADRSACPSADVLASAAAKELPDAARAEVVKHLRGCARCSDEYRLAAGLGAWAERSAATLAAPAAPRRPQPWLLGGFAQAALVLIATGLGAWNVSLQRGQRELVRQAERELNARIGESEAKADALRRELAALSEPQLDVVIADLEPRQAVRGGAAASGQAIVVPEGARFVSLILNTTAERHPDYRMTIRGRDGSVVWSGSGLRRTGGDAFAALLPARLLPPGEYRISIEGMRGQETRALEEYALAVRGR